MSCESPVLVDLLPGGILVTPEQSQVVVDREEVTEVVIAPGEQGPPGATGTAGVQGPPGEPGIRVVGAVQSVAMLPSDADRGELWVTRDDGHGFVWNGFDWVDIGLVAIRGPAGTDGKHGQIRYTGHGEPGLIVGAEPGDTYLDVLTGTIYKLM